MQIFSEFVYGLKYSHGIITHDCFLDGEQNIMGKGKFDIMLLKKNIWKRQKRLSYWIDEMYLYKLIIEVK